MLFSFVCDWSDLIVYFFSIGKFVHRRYIHIVCKVKAACIEELPTASGFNVLMQCMYSAGFLDLEQ